MAKDLPYFRFDPGQYLSGSIQFCTLKAQGLFINILSIYWQRGCDLTITQVKKRWDEPELIQELINENIIKVNRDKITIQFLDNHYNNVIDLSSKRSENGKVGNAKRWGSDLKPIANGSQTDRKDVANISHLDNIIQDKTIQDNSNIAKKVSRKRAFNPPSVDEVKAYFELKGYSSEGAIAAFEYYSTADWVDSRGNPVLNWKQKCLANWFKPQYKTQTHQEQKRGLVH